MCDTPRMFLRATLRRKDGKDHRYWSVVENRRVRGGRTVQQTVLYLGEINDAQHARWCRKKGTGHLFRRKGLISWRGDFTSWGPSARWGGCEEVSTG